MPALVGKVILLRGKGSEAELTEVRTNSEVLSPVMPLEVVPRAEAH